MKKYVVKRFSNSLHVILPKDEFKQGELVHVAKDFKWERRVREIVKEEIQGLRQEY